MTIEREVTKLYFADGGLAVVGVFTDVCEQLINAGQTGGFAHLTLVEKVGDIGEWRRGGMIAVNPRHVVTATPGP